MAQYQPAPVEWRLPADEIHIWRLPTTRAPEELEQLASYLTDEERQRVDRFHFDVDRQRAIVSRGSLRRLTGIYLGVAPRSLEFDVGRQGKLSLASPHRGELSLNVTHSHELVLYAFARHCELGLDVEHLRVLSDVQAIARRHFTPSEIELLRQPSTSSLAVEQNFFRLWTRKEAVIKGVGTGLSTPLDAFDVSSAAGEAGSWFQVDVPAPNSSTWLVRDLPIDDGYCAALAVARQPAAVRFWTS